MGLLWLLQKTIGIRAFKHTETAQQALKQTKTNQKVPARSGVTPIIFLPTHSPPTCSHKIGRCNTILYLAIINYSEIHTFRTCTQKIYSAPQSSSSY